MELGKGRAYGVELMLEKRSGRVHGWVSYTLSRSTRQFENINYGRTFSYKYDWPHNLSVTLVWQLAASRQISLNWIFASGNPTSFAFEHFETYYHRYNTIFPNSMRHYGENYSYRNNYRLPPYHRGCRVHFPEADEVGRIGVDLRGLQCLQ